MSLNDLFRSPSKPDCGQDENQEELLSRIFSQDGEFPCFWS